MVALNKATHELCAIEANHNSGCYSQNYISEGVPVIIVVALYKTTYELIMTNICAGEANHNSGCFSQHYISEGVPCHNSGCIKQIYL